MKVSEVDASCREDESRPLAAAVQTEAANRLGLLPLRAVVVNAQGRLGVTGPGAA